jgi:hypothetical protein
MTDITATLRALEQRDPVATQPLRHMLALLSRRRNTLPERMRGWLLTWSAKDTARLAHRAGAVVAPSTISMGCSRDLPDPAYGSLHVTGREG